MFKYKKSDYFWNFLAMIVLCLIAKFSLIALAVIQVVMLILIIFILVHNMVEEDFESCTTPDYYKMPIVFYINPVMWLFFIISGSIWLINNPIKKFNTWLNEERERKLKFKEFTKKEYKGK